MRTFRTNADQGDHFVPQTRTRIAEMNQAARRLGAAANELERVAKKGLPQA